MAAPQGLILLVGMHRSGTSLAASLLDSLGVNVPGPWGRADEHNPAGYYELLTIRDLQEQLLSDLNRVWASAAGTLPLPQRWLDAPCSLRAMDRLEAILRHEADRQTGPWAIKDPRSSLLLPLWRRVCEQLGIELRLLQALRDPAAVMQSLLRRDGPRAGMTPDRAQAIWWHHNAQLLRDGQGLPRLTITYETWFTSRASEQLNRMADFCLAGPAAAERLEAAMARIRPEHRHDQAAPKTPAASALRRNRRLYRQLAANPSTPLRPAGIHGPLSRWRPSEPALLPDRLPAHCCLAVVGAEASHWTVHAWLNRCPLPQGVRFSAAREAVRLTLHLQPLALSRAQGRLGDLRSQAIVLDPSLNQVEMLRQEGVNAFWIDPQGPGSGWLEGYFVAERCAQRFGLPCPDALAQPGRMLCLGSLGAEEDRGLGGEIWGLPQFDRLHVADVDDARLLASWLNRCNARGLQLVRLTPTPVELHGNAWSALDRPIGPSHGAWMPAPLLQSPINRSELEEELAWRRSGCPQDPCLAPNPPTTTLWQWPEPELERLHDGAPAATGPAAEVAVCITLYNYGNWIERALESVRRQTIRPLELIVVDDGSQDDGVDRVRAWLERHGRDLGRSLLLVHDRNSGLGAARNTAFAAATAPWCQVLDADNELEPEALELCLSLARSCPSSTAVVHPLLELRGEEGLAGHHSGRALLEGGSWQASALVDGNKIDAMALIRRASWQKVGGYAAVSGWEDYDLWCRFIEAGFHGVACPQRLAIYHRHRGSMLNDTNRDGLRQLKRLMQQRHHWLQLLPQPT